MGQGALRRTSDDRLPAVPARRSWVRARADRMVAAFTDLLARRSPPGGEQSLQRTGGVAARWISYPRGVRLATAGTSAAAAGLAAWGAFALGGGDVVHAGALVAGAAALGSACGPLGVWMANRFHKIITRQRRRTVVELRGLPDSRAVAIRGVVAARRTAASALDGRAAVWTLTRFVSRGAQAFFHEKAFDFLIDDGTDEPIWVEVSGGMILEHFPRDRRVQFSNTTLLELDHPFLTRLRLGDREVRATEINICAGDVVEVVGRLSHRLDPTAPARSSREPPQRRALRSGTRVPVMVRLVPEPDAALARVRRQVPKGPPDVSPGDPPIPRF